METSRRSTRERLLAATIELLERDGWDSVTVRKIGAEAGVNIALVNYHFGSKTNLKLAALEAALQDTVAPPAGDMPHGPGGRDWPEELVHVALGTGLPGGRSRMFESAVAAALHDPDLAARMRPMLVRSRSQLAGWIEREVEAGRLPAGTDAEALAVVLTAVLDGLWIQRIIDPAIDVDRVAGAVASLLRDPTKHRARRPS
jgi:AcrR family transcriptional regulator